MLSPPSLSQPEMKGPCQAVTQLQGLLQWDAAQTFQACPTSCESSGKNRTAPRKA